MGDDGGSYLAVENGSRVELEKKGDDVILVETPAPGGCGAEVVGTVVDENEMVVPPVDVAPGVLVFGSFVLVDMSSTDLVTSHSLAAREGRGTARVATSTGEAKSAANPCCGPLAVG